MLLWFAAAAMFVSFAACNTRPIPGDLILTTYNSDMEVTKSFSPMDTLYVKVAGMRAESHYRVSALDANGVLISMIEARTDANGVIDAIPLWYDMGLKKNETAGLPPYLDSFGGLTPVGFKVNVKSLYDNGDSTNFTQDMFFVLKNNLDTNAKPVIYSCYSPDLVPDVDTIFYPENAFKETGTLDVDGIADPKTVVYVKADKVPTKIGNNVDVTAVDFYVLRFTGEAFKNGDALYSSTKKVTEKIGVAVTAGAVAATKLWDVNDTPQVINPTDDTMAYSIVMDVDRDGIYDEGIDTDSDGVSDYFIDGVDGNGLPGFIIQNTPANDMFVTIKDADGNVVNSIPEIGATASQYLNINIENVPVALGTTITIYLVDSFTGINLDPIPADVRSGSEDVGVGVSDPALSEDALVYLPYITGHALIDTSNIGNYDYPDAGTLTEDVHLDLIVDMNNNGIFNEDTDYFLADAVTILNVDLNPKYDTCSDEAGTALTKYFGETNSEGNTVVYLHAVDAPLAYDVYVMKATEVAGLSVNDPLLRASLFSVSAVGGDSTTVTTEIWDINGEFQVINPSIANNTFYLIMDNNADGLYDAGDSKLTIMILNTNANSYPRLTYLNIASGGAFGNTYNQHWTLYSEFCDYRDVFIKSGLDTNAAGGGYGVKAVFNPYFSWFSNPNPEIPVEGLYYGLYVDVYIVNAATFDLGEYGNLGELNDGVDVTGRHSTIAVQPSCYNGAGMMTIWPATMTPGRYYVIVDVNRNGIIDEGTDIIDAVNQNGQTIIDDATIVGFSVE